MVNFIRIKEMLCHWSMYHCKQYHGRRKHRKQMSFRTKKLRRQKTKKRNNKFSHIIQKRNFVFASEIILCVFGTDFDVSDHKKDCNEIIKNKKVEKIDNGSKISRDIEI